MASGNFQRLTLLFLNDGSSLEESEGSRTLNIGKAYLQK
jgi:hypothetical protein